jgi:hypothetical protein
MITLPCLSDRIPEFSVEITCRVQLAFERPDGFPCLPVDMALCVLHEHSPFCRRVVQRLCHSVPGKTLRRNQPGSKLSTTPLMQYLSPVGGGPSSKTWPRCPPHWLQWTSVRTIPKLRSVVVSIAPSSGEKKLGQPVPLSNLRSALKSGWPQPTHRNVPGRCSSRSAHDPGGSVEWRRSTAYCCGVNMRRHSSSVFSTGKCSAIFGSSMRWWGGP